MKLEPVNSITLDQVLPELQALSKRVKGLPLSFLVRELPEFLGGDAVMKDGFLGVLEQSPTGEYQFLALSSWMAGDLPSIKVPKKEVEEAGIQLRGWSIDALTCPHCGSHYHKQLPVTYQPIYVCRFCQGLFGRVYFEEFQRLFEYKNKKAFWAACEASDTYRPIQLQTFGMKDQNHDIKGLLNREQWLIGGFLTLKDLNRDHLEETTISSPH